ncbi:hypothetical protein [Ferrovibrio sp.]|uniref:hypothetical protein n=1 Tax=Ferrovibrio sp. TaxID=1917215 RepID=UPI00261453D5|nr:hypothetical protein [Ferrovibrio sp.]
MSQQIFRSLTDFGFSIPQLQILRDRLSVPQFVYFSGPAGGGKTKASLMVAWTYFQAFNRPLRIDGQDMTTDQIRQAAKEHNAGILFNDMASVHDYMKAGYCLDCRMVALGTAFDGPAKAGHAYAYLLAHLPTLATRNDVTVIAVGPDDEDPDNHRHSIDFHTG